MNQMFRPDDVPPLPKGDPLTQTYLHGRREWDERIGDARSQASAWKKIAWFSLVVAAGCAGGNVYQGMQSKTQVVHVVHDNIGDVIAVQTANNGVLQPTQAMISAGLRKWVTDVRTVYTDANALRRGILSAYDLVGKGSQANKLLDKYYQTHDPFERAKLETLSLSHVAAIPPPPGTVGANQQQTWRIEWQETVTSRDGVQTSFQLWSANVTLDITPPINQQDAVRNPDGIHITSFSWTEK